METKKTFVASDEARAKAKQLRLFAMLAWLVAIAGQVYAIFKLISEESMVQLIIAIAILLALTIIASMLWKKANRLDPASEKDKTRFFIQTQLGAIMGVLAFLPLVILIFTNKNLSTKTKGVTGIIALVALLISGVSGWDFNPPSIEKYSEEIQAQTDALKNLNQSDLVHWSSGGNKYHIYSDCYHIRDRELSNGTVKQAWEANGISELCKTCEKRAIKEGTSELPTEEALPETKLERETAETE